MIWPVRPLLLILAAALALPPAAAGSCDSSTVLTLVGVDTAARTALFSLPSATGGGRSLLAVDLARDEARTFADPGDWFGGSFGPGPVLAARRCGPSCLQVLRWQDGAWATLGGPLLASPTVLLRATYDGGGAPWVVLHSSAGQEGVWVAQAHRYAAGSWESAGARPVRAVGSPGAAPSPGEDGAIVSGTGRFRADGPPEAWVWGLPDVEGAAAGQAIPLGADAAGLLAADGRLWTSRDGGKKWNETRWKPFAGGEGDLAWQPGQEYWVEVPEGDTGSPGALVWTDNRVPHKRSLHLAEWGGTAWRQLAATPSGILTTEGERLPYNHVLRFGAGHWALVVGCVRTGDGARLAGRELVEGVLGDPFLLPVTGAGVRGGS